MIQELDTSRGTEVHRISATIRFQLYPVLITLNLPFYNLTNVEVDAHAMWQQSFYAGLL